MTFPRAAGAATPLPGGPSGAVGLLDEPALPTPAMDNADRDALLLANVRDSVIVVDGEGIVTYWNAGATRIFGWNAREMVGRPLSLRFPEDTRESIDALTQSILAGVEWSGEFHDYHKDGSRVWIDARVTPMINAEGQNVGVMGVAHDISTRKRAEAERDRLQAQLRSHIERVPLAHVLLDEDFRIVGWNPAAERIFGYTKEEAIGMQPPFTGLLPAGGWSDRENLLAKARAGDVAAHSINDNLRKDGRTITCEWYNTPRFGEDGTFLGMVALAQDVTERRQLEAVGHLAGGVAHDFNNLLTIISGYGDLLLDSLAVQDPLREFVEEIRKAGDRSAALTRQLLAFSRKQVLAPRTVDLNGIVLDTEKMLRRVIGEDVELRTSLHSPLGSVEADPGQLEQALLNLAVNARDAMPQGGTLTIATKNTDVGDETPHPGFPIGPYVVLEISDSGTGMSQEVKRHLFEPFFTTKGPGKGTGLGLAVVHGFVKQSGGHVAVHSEQGLGTTFRIYLPRLDRSVSVKDVSSQATPLLPRGKETILLVEDEDGVRVFARRVLERCGYRVLEATNSEAALHALAADTGSVDLIVTDVVMPGGGGRSLAEQVRVLRPGVRVLYMSGYTDDAVVRHGVLHDQVNFLQKPFSPLALARKVREVLGQ
jgi:two-component system cell cycle sensor histidine kinase/response regulator CckA